MSENFLYIFQKKGILMIAQFFKKSSLIITGLMFISINATNEDLYRDDSSHHVQPRIEESHHIQILINPTDPSFMFNLFDGSSIVTDIFASRPAGGYYYLNGLIFPKKTIDPKTQACFNFDRHGNVLDESNSVGVFRWIANQLVEVKFNNNFPAKGTIVEDVRWDFYFTKKCRATMNNISAFGQVAAGVFQSNSIGFQADGMSVIATMCNGTYNCIKRAKVYFNNFNCTFGTQMVILVEFQNDILYAKNN